MIANMIAKFEFRHVSGGPMEVDIADLYDGKVGPGDVINHYLPRLEGRLKSMKHSLKGMDDGVAHLRKEELKKEILKLEAEILRLPKHFGGEGVGIHAFSDYWKSEIRNLRNIQADQGCIVPPKE